HSAFMRLLAERRDGELRRLLADVHRRDPRVLERYVNYLTTPDEESARVKFGTGDRYFGLATLLCTLPGLPLFGHGQAEGLAETYGMEFAAPRRDERPDEGFRAHHRRVLAPLLAQRERFAAASGLVLMRVLGADGRGRGHVHAHGFGAAGRRGPAPVVCNHSGERARADARPGRRRQGARARPRARLRGLGSRGPGARRVQPLRGARRRHARRPRRARLGGAGPVAAERRREPRGRASPRRPYGGLGPGGAAGGLARRPRALRGGGLPRRAARAGAGRRRRDRE